jgi:uncharacterized membrane protein YfcA
VVRANLMVFFVLLGAMIFVTYAVQGLLTADILALSILLCPPYVVAMAVGTRCFRGASDRTYRRVAYTIVAVAAAVSLPLFDRLLR